MMTPPPFCSIIIPTHNRPRQLTECLRALAGLDYPRARFEVVVVDDGSPTPPREVIDATQGQITVTLISQRKAGPAAARNTGARRADGQFLAFTDDDCAPAAHWLRVLVARLTQAPGCAIGGRTVNAYPANSYSEASQLLVSYLYSYYNRNPNQAQFLTTNNLAVPAYRFHQVGMFDQKYTRAAAEDRELCDRWLSRGFRLIYEPDALVYHAHYLTLRSFWRQHFAYGRGALGFHQARAQRGQERMHVEPPAFYLDLIRYPFTQTEETRRRASRPGALPLASLLLLSQVANTAGYLRERLTSASG